MGEKVAPRAGFEPATNRLTAISDTAASGNIPVHLVTLVPNLLALLISGTTVWQHLATPKHPVSVAKPLPRGSEMMVKRNLTDRKINSLKRDRSLEDKLGHYDTWDTVVPGLGVRVSKTGRRTFVLMTRYPGDKHPDGASWASMAN